MTKQTWRNKVQSSAISIYKLNCFSFEIVYLFFLILHFLYVLLYFFLNSIFRFVSVNKILVLIVTSQIRSSGELIRVYYIIYLHSRNVTRVNLVTSLFLRISCPISSHMSVRIKQSFINSIMHSQMKTFIE